MRFRHSFLIVSALALNLAELHSAPQVMGTAFTYQGQLSSGGSALNGHYDFAFTLYDASTGGNQVGSPCTNLNVVVAGGAFMAVVDFGPHTFAGNAAWLGIGARTNGGAAFTPLDPRQPLMPVPNAMFAGSTTNFTGNVAFSQLPPGILTNNATGVSLNGSFAGNGTALNNIPAGNLVGQVNASNLPALLDAQASLPFGMMQQGAGMPANYQSDIYRLPPMGYCTWYDSSTSVSEFLITNLVTTMSQNGLRDAGYTIVQLDDGWCRGHDTNGNVQITVTNGSFYPLTPHPYDTNNWPNGMAYCANFCHSNGMKFGLYVGLGPATCAGYAGSYGYFSNDFKTFSAWGVDYFKLEGCTQPTDPLGAAIVNIDYARDAAPPSDRWLLEQAAFASTQFEHPAFLNASWWWNLQPWLASEFNSFRAFGDSYGDGVSAGFIYQNCLYKFDALVRFSYLTGPGHFLDPDVIANSSLSANPAMFRSILSAYAMMDAPLMLTWPPHAEAVPYEINRGMIAIDQDPLVQPAAPAPSMGTNAYSGTNLWSQLGQFSWPMFTNCVYVKNLGTPTGPQKAVMMMNRSSAAISQTVYWSDLGFLPGTVASISNVWSGQNVGNYAGSFTANVGPNDVGLFLVSASQAYFGDGSSLSNLNAGNLDSGTLADARLAANVELLDVPQNNTAAKVFSGGLSTSSLTLTSNPARGNVVIEDALGNLSGTNAPAISGANITGPLPAGALPPTIVANNGFVSQAANPILAIAATGVTNTMGVNADAYVTCNVATFTNFNYTGAPVLTNLNATFNHQMFHLQPGGSIRAASGLSGAVVPW